MANSNYGQQNYGNSATSYGQNQMYGNTTYQTTSYGAQGGNDGGGFMEGSQGASQGGGGKQYGKDTLRPVTILQVNEANLPHPDAEFTLDDAELGQVTFIGQIRNISKQATNMTYKLDDGTATIDIKQWIDVDASMPEFGEERTSSKPQLAVGDWVKVWGKLKMLNGKRIVGAQVMRPIVDKNEINYHLLEAVYVHLYFTRGPPDQLNAASGGLGQQGNGQESDTYGAGAAQRMPNLSLHARKVLKCLQDTPSNNEGLHVQNIAALTGMQISEVLKGGDELLTQSLVYTTVDDNTWALLDM